MTPPAAAAAAVHPRPDVAPGRRRTAPARPRRTSGPVRPAPSARPSRSSRPSRTGGGIALGTLSALERVANHRLLDRLIRGRASIGIVAFALIGIVTLQLGLLKLNTSIGRTLERESQLQRQNATLSVENSELTEANRVESSAAQLGMEPVPAGALRFLSARAGVDAARGAAAIKTSIQASGGEAGSTRAAAGEPPEAGASPTSTSESNRESAPKPAGPASSGGSGEATAQGAPASTQPAPGTSPDASVPGGSSSEAAPSGGGTAGSAGTADGAGGQAAPTG
jgi:cell division protein FtsL